MKKMKNTKTVFPTVGELVKFLIESFDFYELVSEKKRKSFNKEIDRFANEKDFDLDRAEELISQLVLTSFNKIMPAKEFAEYLGREVKSVLERYKELILNTSTETATREEVTKTLITHFFSHILAIFIRNANQFLQKSDIKLLSPQKKNWLLPYIKNNEIVSPITTVIDWWVEETDSDSLFKLVKKITKGAYRESEQTLLFYQKYKRWSNNKNLPKSSSIFQLTEIDFKTEKNKELTKKSLMFNLFSARAVQFCFNYVEKLFGIEDSLKIFRNIELYLDSNNFSFNKKDLIDFQQRIFEIGKKDEVLLKENHVIFKINELNMYTSLELEKEPEIELLTEKIIKELENSKFFTEFYKYNIYWYRAKFFILNPDPSSQKSALTYYEKAFDAAKYCAGKKAIEIIREGITLAAKMGKKKNFKKFYKWANFYGLFLESFAEVEHYILDYQKKQFYSIFSPKAYYRNDIKTNEKLLKQMTDNFMINLNKLSGLKVDRRYPNREIKGIEPRPLTQLMIFAPFGQKEKVKELLELGANPNKIASDGSTALVRCIEDQINVLSDDNIECAKMLLEKDLKSSINAKTNQKKITALQCAIESGYEFLVKLILDSGAAVDQRCSLNGQQGLSPLYYAINKICTIKKYNKDNNLFSKDKNQLIKAFKSQDIFKYSGKTLYDRDFERTISQLENDHKYMKISKTVTNYMMKMEQEKILQYYNIIDMLISYGANVDEEHDYGFTPVLLSAEAGDIPILKKLVNNNADLFKVDCKNTSILAHAIIYENFEYANYLLDNYDMASVVNLQFTDYKFTALHYIAEVFSNNEHKNHLEANKLLDKILILKPNISIKDSQGNTALDIANKYSNWSFIEKLEYR